MTEACFHKLPLQFASDKQVLRYMYTNQTDNKTEVEITATRVSKGTVPAGSTWTRNPVSYPHSYESTVGSCRVTGCGDRVARAGPVRQR